MLAWTPLDIGVLKLNVDGSRKGNTGSIGAGGVLSEIMRVTGLLAMLPTWGSGKFLKLSYEAYSLA